MEPEISATFHDLDLRHCTHRCACASGESESRGISISSCMGKIYNSWGTPPYSWGGAEPPPRCITHTLVQPPGPPGVPQAPSPYHSSRVTAEAETGQRRQRPIPLSLNWLIV